MANTKIQSEQIEDGAITAAKIADGAIVASEVADNAITTAKINADAVTGAKIADNAIDSEHYTDGSIDTAHIADDQVTQAKMANDSVGADELASSAVVTASIVDDAVTSAKLDTNIDIAGTFDVTGATTLDSTLAVAGDANFDSGTLFVDVSANNVGIGDTNPSAKLDVNSGTTNTIAHFHSTDDNGFIELKDDDTTGYIGVQNDYVYIGGAPSTSTQNLVINDGSGKVGIGTTSPASTLHTSGTGVQRIQVDATDNNAAGAGLYMKVLNSGSLVGNATVRVDNVGNIDFFNGTSSESKKMVLQADGKLAVTEIRHISAGNLEIGNDDEKHIMHSDGYHQFQVSDTEIIRINGEGIAFNGDSAAANSLDDYEEGSWSPAVNGATTTINDAHYVKIGAFVYLNTYLYFSGLPNDGAVFKITGLPYATQPNSTYGGGAISYSHAANTADMQPLTQTGDSYIYFHETDGTSNTVTRATAYSKFANGAGYLVLNMTYITNF